MKLQLDCANRALHVRTCDWSSTGEMYAYAEDTNSIQVLDRSLRGSKQLLALPSPVTDMHVLPYAAQRRSKDVTEIAAIGDVAGRLCTITSSGRLEKSVEASKSPITCVRWSPDGIMLASATEDGVVSIWSRNLASQRAIFMQASHAILQCTWDAKGTSIAAVAGQSLLLGSLQNGVVLSLDDAHEGLMLCVDWGGVHDMVVTGGEDCRYKLWTRQGQRLYSSPPLAHPVTCVAWSPTRSMFTVGMHDLLLLCNDTGNTLSKLLLTAGSVLRVSWSWCGSAVAAACANATVCTADVVGQTWRHKGLTATLTQPTEVSLYNAADDTTEFIDVHHRVLSCSLSHNRLLITTATRCMVVNPLAVNTPHTLDMAAPVVLMRQATSCFVVVDAGGGVQVLSYEARLLSHPTIPGLQGDTVVDVSLTDDVLAYVDPLNPTMVRLLDPTTGRPCLSPLTHTHPITTIHLMGHHTTMTAADRVLAFVDSMQTLWVWRCGPGGAPCRLSGFVRQVVLHDHEDMLAAVVDTSLHVWFHPAAAFIDNDLLAASTYKCPAGGDGVRLAQCCGWWCLMTKHTGSSNLLSRITLPPYPLVVTQLALNNKWAEAQRVCRTAKDTTAWACLASFALKAGQLSLALQCYAALDKVHKVHVLKSLTGAGGGAGDPLSQGPTKAGAPSAAATRHAVVLALLRGDAVAAEVALCRANCPLLAMHVAARACAWPRVDALTQQHPALAPWAAVLHGQVHVSKEQQVGGVDQAVNKPMLVNELESLGLQHMW